jgi:hypothetical protein
MVNVSIFVCHLSSVLVCHALPNPFAVPYSGLRGAEDQALMWHQIYGLGHEGGHVSDMHGLI